MRHRQASPPRSRTLTTTKGETAVLFVGWDSASTSHAVTILDTSGMIMDRWTLGHTESDLDTILARLAAHGDPADLPVAIERSDGLVVARLLAAGHPVVPINPGAFHAARPRWSAAGAKSDPGDSYKLADYLRTDGHRPRRLQPPDSVTCELQSLVRLRDDHVAAKTAASNQLGALLDAHWPGAKQVFFRPASKIALAFLAEYPTPQAAARLYQAHLTAFCRRHAYRGGQSPATLLKRLHVAPQPPVGLHPAVLAQVVGAQSSCSPRRCLPPSPNSTGRSASGSPSTPRPGCWPRCPASARSASANCSPRSGRSWTAPPAPNMPLARSAPPRSRAPRARPAACTSAWPPTAGHARLCTSSPTTHATAPRGRPPSPPTPAPAASATHRPSASSAAPGSQSCEPAGTPTPPTTRPSTAPNNASLAEDLTQETQTLPRPGGVRSPLPDQPGQARRRLTSIGASLSASLRDDALRAPACGYAGSIARRW